ncbi:hypothetical protein OG361_13700 [Streptomyces sp. NBC_00090]|uniref:hypothetical protein n=1 Tax=Streptomyces sp. NBC_00090 TaxID=2903619 RepID=UPI00324AB204
MIRTTIPEGDERGEVRMPDDGQGIGSDGGLRRAVSWIAVTVAAGAGVLLAVGAFLGLYVRPTSDDWCALWKARDMGVLGITADFYRTQNGRVTNAFLTGLIYTDDMRGPKLLPAFLVVALGAGLFFLGRAALRALRPAHAPDPHEPDPHASGPAPGPAARSPVVLLAAAAALLSALLFFAGTRSYQVLLWAPATISHTLPSVIGLWAVLAAVRAAHSGRRWARSAAVGSVLLAGTALGMLSEPFALVAGVFAATAGLLCLPRLGWTRDRYVSTWCAAACLGLAVGLVLLTTSPGARWRRAQHPKEPLSFPLLGETFRDWWHVWETIGGQWAYAGAAAIGVLLGLGLSRATPGPAATTGRGPRGRRGLPSGLPPRRLFRIVVLLPLPLIALASLGVTYGLRSGYGDVGWTYGRTWTSFLLPLLLALCAYGTWGGYRLGLLLRAAGRPAARAAALVAVGAIAVGSTAALVRPVYALTTDTVVRGVAWDRQNARIRAEVAAGAREVAYGPLLIGQLTEPLFAPTYERDWAAQCTARYYGVERIHRP